MADMHPQTAASMGQLLQRLAGNPKTRARQLELVKELDPTYRLPADVAIEQLEAKHKAEREADKRQQWEERRRGTLAQQRRKLLEAYDEEQIKAIETGIMKKYPNLDYLDAAKLYASDTTPAAPAGNAKDRYKPGQYWEFPSIPGLLENPDRAATDMAYSVIDELRGRR